MTDDTKSLITVLLLVFAYPIGAIVMFFWTKWPVWVKILIGLPLLLLPLAFVGIIVAAMLVTVNPSEQINKAKDVMMQNYAMEVIGATERYFGETGRYPWGMATEAYQSDNVATEAWVNELVAERELKAETVEKLRSESNMILISPGGETERMVVCFRPNSAAKIKEAELSNGFICVP